MGRVLVVDDNELNSMLASDILEACGVSSDTADSGEKAVKMVMNNDYSFILMDNIMPGISGVEATARIMKLKPASVIYAMTGEMNEKTSSAFTEAGAAGMLSKPLVLSQITDILVRHLEAGTYELPNASDHQESRKSGEKPDLLPFLKNLDGLNTDKGLTNAVGSEDTYYRVLKASVSNIRMMTDTMREYRPGDNADSMKVATHSLKGIFANIGLNQLEWESIGLERSVDSIINSGPDADAAAKKLENGIAPLIEKSEDFALRLELALAEYNKAAAENTEEFYLTAESPLSDADMKETLDYTLKALDCCEIDYLNEGLELLKKASIADARRAMENAQELAGVFDYDGIRKLINETFPTEAESDQN